MYFPTGPVDGSWGSWKKANERNGECSRSCGGGTETWRRLCDSPAPAHGGKDCDGDHSQQRRCNTHQCIVPGKEIEQSKKHILLTNKYLHFQLPDSGEGGCPGADAPRHVEEELSLSPGTVTLLPRPMEETIAWGILGIKDPATTTNVSR